MKNLEFGKYPVDIVETPMAFYLQFPTVNRQHNVHRLINKLYVGFTREDTIQKLHIMTPGKKKKPTATDVVKEIKRRIRRVF